MHIRLEKVKNTEHFVCIAFNLATKMGHSLLAKLCYSEQNMLFLDRQIKGRILELSIRWSKATLQWRSLFYAISFEGKDCYRVVSVGQLGFDCCL